MTVTEDATNDTIAFYGAAAEETINVGQQKTIEFEGETYTIECLGTNADGTSATIKIDGEAQAVDEGDEETLSGLTFRLKDVGRYDLPGGTGYSGYVTLSIGSSKFILQHGEPVQVGDDAEEIDGTNVTITTGSEGVSVIKIDVAASDEDFQYLYEGAENAFTDPVFGTFKMAFGGISPAEDSSLRETIKVGVSGDDKATVNFETAKGDSDTVEFAYYDGSNLELELDKETIVVVEGENVAEDQYLVVNAGDFSHLLEVKNIKAGDEVVLSDVFSGAQYTVSIGTNNKGTKYIDGQAYYFSVADDDSSMNVTWKSHDSDTGVGYNNPGSHTTVFPGIKTSNGAYVHLMENVTFTAATNIVLPGDTVSNSADPAVAVEAAGLDYYVNVSVGSVTFFADGPSVVVVEEDDSDDVQHSVLVPAKMSSGEVNLGNAVLSGQAGSTYTLETDDDVEKSIDVYGTVVAENSQDNVVEIMYPDDQAIASVALGANPVFGATGTSGGVIQEAVQIKNSVSKMESEVNTDTLDRDLVLIGGPCANSLVAELLEMSAASGQCDTDFLAEYPNEGVITVVEDAFGSGQMALIVAGVTRDDTRDLAEKVMQGTLDYGA
jgi:hypothetical protein